MNLKEYINFIILISIVKTNIFFISRYDVELFQRIEHLLEKKLPLYETVEEEVMLLSERVAEAQRYAKLVIIALFFFNDVT